MPYCYVNLGPSLIRLDIPTLLWSVAFVRSLLRENLFCFSGEVFTTSCRFEIYLTKVGCLSTILCDITFRFPVFQLYPFSGLKENQILIRTFKVCSIKGSIATLGIISCLSVNYRRLVLNTYAIRFIRLHYIHVFHGRQVMFDEVVAQCSRIICSNSREGISSSRAELKQALDAFSRGPLFFETNKYPWSDGDLRTPPGAPAVCPEIVNHCISDEMSMTEVWSACLDPVWIDFVEKG